MIIKPPFAEMPAFMSTSQEITAVLTGVIFLTALITGVWKWRHMLASPNYLAPPYVDIAHRSALMYSFAGILVWHFAGWSAWPEWLNVTASLALMIFFMAAIVTYIALGFRNETDNQFKPPHKTGNGGMWALLLAEVGGFLVLFSGFLRQLFVGS